MARISHQHDSAELNVIDLKWAKSGLKLLTKLIKAVLRVVFQGEWHDLRAHCEDFFNVDHVFVTISIANIDDFTHASNQDKLVCMLGY